MPFQADELHIIFRKYMYKVHHFLQSCMNEYLLYFIMNGIYSLVLLCGDRFMLPLSNDYWV